MLYKVDRMYYMITVNNNYKDEANYKDVQWQTKK